MPRTGTYPPTSAMPAPGVALVGAAPDVVKSAAGSANSGR